MNEIEKELLATLRAIVRKGTHREYAKAGLNGPAKPEIVTMNQYAKIAETAIKLAEKRIAERDALQYPQEDSND